MYTYIYIWACICVYMYTQRKYEFRSHFIFPFYIFILFVSVISFCKKKQIRGTNRKIHILDYYLKFWILFIFNLFVSAFVFSVKCYIQDFFSSSIKNKILIGMFFLLIFFYFRKLLLQINAT